MAWRRAAAEGATPRNRPRATWMSNGSQIGGVGRLEAAGSNTPEAVPVRPVPPPPRRATQSCQARPEEA